MWSFCLFLLIPPSCKQGFAKYYGYLERCQRPSHRSRPPRSQISYDQPLLFSNRYPIWTLDRSPISSQKSWVPHRNPLNPSQPLHPNQSPSPNRPRDPSQSPNPHRPPNPNQSPNPNRPPDPNQSPNPDRPPDPSQSPHLNRPPDPSQSPHLNRPPDPTSPRT